jgi:hypothetical protein
MRKRKNSEKNLLFIVRQISLSILTGILTGVAAFVMLLMLLTVAWEIEKRTRMAAIQEALENQCSHVTETVSQDRMGWEPWDPNDVWFGDTARCHYDSFNSPDESNYICFCDT